MDPYTSFRDPKLAGELITALKEPGLNHVRFMEVCGTHTVSIAKHAIRQLMPPDISLTSGPGCPVCVTSTRDIDRFIAASQLPDTIITTFGDLLRVPGSYSTLREEMSKGADIRIVYSPLDALEMARTNPEKEIIFLGVGFETTAPTIGASIVQAKAEHLKNYSVISSHKVMPPPLELLISDPKIQLDGLICPGHVSVVIGAKAYRPLVEKYKIPCVITGFEPVDILQGIVMLAQQIRTGKPDVEIAYQRAVTEDGNPKAQEILNTVFTPKTVDWRGLGPIPGSGLAISNEYSDYDAEHKFTLDLPETREPRGCLCGNVLKGIILPNSCKLFGKACKPEHPVGPCMVSSEGACAAYYRYEQ